MLYPAGVIACASYILCLHSISEGYQLSEFLEAQHAHVIYEAFALNGSDESGLIPGKRFLPSITSDNLGSNLLPADVLALLLDFYAHIQPFVPEKLWRLNPFTNVCALFTSFSPLRL